MSTGGTLQQEEGCDLGMSTAASTFLSVSVGIAPGEVENNVI
jgi:hypothetical protein